MKRCFALGVYKAFNFNGLTLIFYRVYLCFILELRTPKTNIIGHMLSYNNCFLDTDSFSFIDSKRLFQLQAKAVLS